MFIIELLAELFWAPKHPSQRCTVINRREQFWRCGSDIALHGSTIRTVLSNANGARGFVARTTAYSVRVTVPQLELAMSTLRNN